MAVRYATPPIPVGGAPASFASTLPTQSPADDDDANPDVGPARNLSHQFENVIKAPGGSGYVDAQHPVAKSLNRHRNFKGLASLAHGGASSSAQHSQEASSIVRGATNQFSGGI